MSEYELSGLLSGPPRRICLVSDAWEPQVNGVVRTWQQVTGCFREHGHEVMVIHPGLFKSFPTPRYPEIRTAVFPGPKLARLLADFNPDAIHIATEGSVGLAARRWCRRRKRAFTTSYHTQYPHYLKKYFLIPPKFTYWWMRCFHNAGAHCFVPTKTVGEELTAHGFNPPVTWSRGVDTAIFHNRYTDVPEGMKDLERPLFLYAGRVAIEKNLDAFLSLDLPGTKVIIGDGPAKEPLAKKYPDTYFAGYRFGEELAAHYAAGDVFVFPSLTDTFGVVMIEANACGLPVAAFPVTGPIDVIREGHNGCLNDDLRAAALDALKLDREACARSGASNTWEKCADIVFRHLQFREG